MAVNETIVTGRKFRKLVDSANKSWQRISFWHKASDCEFDDGKTAQTKVGAISGITSDLSGESENVAASIKCVNSLNNSLKANSKHFYFDYKNGKYGFNTDSNRGADTFFPFNSGISFENATCILSGGKSVAITAGKKYVAVALGHTQSDTQGASVSISAPTCDITYLTEGIAWGNYSINTGHHIIAVALLDCKSNGTVACSYYWTGGMLVFELES